MSAGHKSKKVDRKLPSLILTIFSIALFFPPLNAASGTGLLRLALTSIAVGMLLILLILQKRIQYALTKPLLILSIYPLYLCLHAILEGNVSTAIWGTADRNLGVITSFVCLGFYVLGFLIRVENKGSFIWIISALEIGQFIIFSTKYFGLVDNSSLGSFYNSNPTSLLFGLTTIVLLVNFFESKPLNFGHSIQVFILLAISVGVLVWIGSAQGYIGFFGSLILYSLKFSNKLSKNLARIQIFLILLGYTVFISYVLGSKMPSISRANGNSFYERLEIYKTSMRIIGENLLFGIGIDEFNLGYYKYNYTSNLKLVDNAHSILLQITTTVGIVGLAIAGFVLIRTILLSLPNAGAKNSHLVAGMHFYLISGCFAIQVPGIEFLLFFILGFGLTTEVKTEKCNQVKKPVAGMIVVSALLTVALSGKAFFSYTEFSRAVALPISSPLESVKILSKESDSVMDISLLFRAGERAIAMKDKKLGLEILQSMITRWPTDQRTVAYALTLGNFFSDQAIVSLGKQLDIAAHTQGD